MKKVLLLGFISLVCSSAFGQWTSNGDIISTTQNVGIGTSSPEYKLDVNGDIRLRNLALPGGNQISMNLWDNLTYQGRRMGHYALGWMNDLWCAGGYSLWQSGYGGIKFFTQGQFRMGINVYGNVGIGTESPTHTLDVNGDIKTNNLYTNGTVYANEVKIEATKWSDFVFDKDYKLLSLEEVKTHIEEHKHLPDVPSEKQVMEEGINVAEMQAKLLQKIEELTLYVIQQDRTIKEQGKLIENLQRNK